MKIQDFALKIGMSPQNLSRILSRDIKLTEGTAKKIADALNIEPWYLIYGIAARHNALKSAILQLPPRLLTGTPASGVNQASSKCGGNKTQSARMQPGNFKGDEMKLDPRMTDELMIQYLRDYNDDKPRLIGLSLRQLLTLPFRFLRNR